MKASTVAVVVATVSASHSQIVFGCSLEANALPKACPESGNQASEAMRAKEWRRSRAIDGDDNDDGDTKATMAK